MSERGRILSPTLVTEAVKRAAEMMSGIGYNGPLGTVHLMSMNLQSNAISSIFHNFIAYQISLMASNCKFFSKGGRTPDLETTDGIKIQIKTSSDSRIKGNSPKISPNEGFYICVKYRRLGFTIQPEGIKIGYLVSGDWIGNDKTQFGFLTKEGEAKLETIYPPCP